MPSSSNTSKKQEPDDFDRSLNFVLKWEGGLVNDPADTGGLTNLGISMRGHPELSEDDIVNMTREKAAAIYRRDYWKASGANLLKWPLALVVFDTAVNAGVNRAKTFLSFTSFQESPEAAAEKIIKARRDFYSSIAASRPSNRKFLKGWNARLDDLEKEAGIRK